MERVALGCVAHRRDRFYTEGMDASIRAHLDLLQAMFKCYKAKVSGALCFAFPLRFL